MEDKRGYNYIFICIHYFKRAIKFLMEFPLQSWEEYDSMDLIIWVKRPCKDHVEEGQITPRYIFGRGRIFA